MKYKFLISLLTSVFFFSTTALPVSLHTCRMMGIIPVKACKMKVPNIKKSCCESEEVSNIISFHNHSSDKCCSTHLIDKTVKDNFISVKFDNKNLNSIKLLAAVIPPEELTGYTNRITFFYKGNSPPALKTNKLYLLNSILLI